MPAPVLDVPNTTEVHVPTAPVIKGPPAKTGRSSLGGGAKILQGLQDFAKAQEPKPETPPSTILPPEKPVGKATAPDVPGPSGTAKDDPTQTADTKTAAQAIPSDKSIPTDKAVGSDGMTAEQRAEFVANKKGMESWKAEREQIVAERAELQKSLDAIKSELEQKSARLKEVEPAAIAYNLRLEPTYKEKFEQPAAAIGQYLDKVCEKFSLKQPDVMAAIWNQDEFAGNQAIAEFKSTMDGETASTFSRAIHDLRRLHADEQKLMADPVAAMSALMEDKKKREIAEKEKAEKQARELYASRRDEVWGEMLNRFPVLKDDALAPALDEIKTDASEVDWDKASPDSKAYYALAGQAFLRFPSVIKSLRDELEQTKVALQKATRQVSPASGTRTEPGNDTIPKGIKPSEFLKSKGFGMR